VNGSGLEFPLLPAAGEWKRPNTKALNQMLKQVQHDTESGHSELVSESRIFDVNGLIAFALDSKVDKK
jgi:hypothetical protein